MTGAETTGVRQSSEDPTTSEPPDAVRGHVVVLAGLHETADDFELLVSLLTVVGFRVTVFDDVSRDVQASTAAVVRTLRERRATEPVVLVGSDLGAVVVAGLVTRNSSPVAGAVIGNLVTPASRPSTVTVADFAAFEEAFPGRPPREARLPVGVRLPEPHDVLLPCLVFHGDSDDVTGVADAVSWASQLPFGSLRIVPEGDHHVLTGPAARTIAASIVLFVERQLAGRAVLVDGFGWTTGRSA